jgi:hypothetical protein
MRNKDEKKGAKVILSKDNVESDQSDAREV